jgi:hypothetical protein
MRIIFLRGVVLNYEGLLCLIHVHSQDKKEPIFSEAITTIIKRRRQYNEKIILIPFTGIKSEECRQYRLACATFNELGDKLKISFPDSIVVPFPQEEARFDLQVPLHGFVGSAEITIANHKCVVTE